MNLLMPFAVVLAVFAPAHVVRDGGLQAVVPAGWHSQIVYGGYSGNGRPLPVIRLSNRPLRDQATCDAPIAPARGQVVLTFRGDE